MRLAMTWKDSAGTLSIRLAPGTRMLPPLKRPLQVRVAGSKDSKSVVFEGKPVEVRL
jgi:hypothetical protein